MQGYTEIRNYRLFQATQEIFRLNSAAKKDMFRIAIILLKIQSEKLYEEGGYTNIYEYGDKVLGYKKAMTNNLVRIAGQYINRKSMKSILATEKCDYSISQLQELLIITPEESKQLSEAGIITPSMSSKSIREAVKEYKKCCNDDSKTNEDELNEQNSLALKNFNILYNELRCKLFNMGCIEDVNALLESMYNAVMALAEKR